MKRDKLLHTAVGFAGTLFITLIIVLVVGMVREVTPIGHWLAIAASWLTMRFIAYTKEMYDGAHPEKHTADTMDAEATIAGASLATAMSLVFLMVTQA